MKKRLSISDILLFTISGVLDFFQEIRDPGNLISNYYKNFYGFVPLRWKKIYLQQVIRKNIKENKLEKKGNRLKITKKGKNYLQNKFPFYYLKKEFNPESWWWVIFDIEEISRYNRDRLRSILKQLRFFMVQKSVWVTPYRKICYKVFEFLKERNLEGKIIIIKGSFLSKKNQNFLLERIQKETIRINEEYKHIYNNLLNSYIDYKKTRKIELLIEKFIESRKKTFELLKKDLILPKSFLPQPWYYEKILRLFKTVWAVIKRNY